MPLRRCLCLFALLLTVTPARADVTPDEVVVIVNESSAISMAIGNYYSLVRGVPASNLCILPSGTSTSETINRATYNTQIRDVVKAFLDGTGLKDQVHILVTTKGVPLRVAGSQGSGTNTNAASVDSELTQLYTDEVPDEGQQGRIPNPFRDRIVPFDEFTFRVRISYLVTRLTGYQTDVDPVTGVPIDILNLIDRSQTPASADLGNFVFDVDSSKSGGYESGTNWLNTSAEKMTNWSFPVIHEQTTTFARDIPSILLYAGWGSNDCCDPGPPYYGEIPAGSGTIFPGTFLPGSITTTFVSTSARTFTDGSQGYGQSLSADLIRQGACGAAGHVYEPYLDAVSIPSRLVNAWGRGLPLAESYYSSIRYLSWMTVIVGDPLMKLDVAPTITNITPNEGGFTGGTAVTITGTRFTLTDSRVFFGEEETVLTVVDDQTMIAESPAIVSDPGGASPRLAGKTVDIRFESPRGNVVVPNAFTYLPPRK
ncbi:MAG: TIGR03790 family protein [Planctomycetota bacterium]